MLGGTSQAIDKADTIKQEVTITMNKLSEGNQQLLSDFGVLRDHHGRIDRLSVSDGEYSEYFYEEDDADAKSLTLDCLKDKSKTAQESQSDSYFVSQSSLTIVSESNLLQNSQWWSMINNSENNSNLGIQNFDSSGNDTNPSLYNESNNQTNALNTSNNINNNHGNTRHQRQTRRRSSLLSDVTFESDDNDDDEQTTESGDSSWANSSALLTTARRFASNHYSGGNDRINNEIIEEEYQDSQEKLHPIRGSTAATAAPAIPRRRISKIYTGQNRRSTNSNLTMKATTKTLADNESADKFETSPSQINPAYALRAMTNGATTAPSIPKRSPSLNSKTPSVKNHPIMYQIYNTSCASIVSSQISQDTEPSFFEDGSAAAAAAAAYLSTPAAVVQQEEVRTVQTTATSNSTDTPVLKNHGNGRSLPREDSLTDLEAPPSLPERQNSVSELHLASFGTFASFEDDGDDIPPVVHEEEPQGSNSVENPSNPKASLHHLPSMPLRTRSSSDKLSKYLSRSSGNRKPASRLNTQPPTCPMRKESNHNIHKNPIRSQAPVIHSNRNAVFNRLRLSSQKPQGHQPAHNHKPPSKPTRTNSSSNNRFPSPAVAVSSCKGRIDE